LAVKSENKTAVAGIVQRRGKVVAKAIGRTAKSAPLMEMVKTHILPETTVYTDESLLYDGIKTIRGDAVTRRAGYRHRRIHHASQVYVDGNIHTNSIEGFWSLLKRGLGGVYHSVSQKHLQSYLDEYAFRYNHRDDEQPMFTSFLCQISKAEHDDSLS
jgi:transposase-like protein